MHMQHAHINGPTHHAHAHVRTASHMHAYGDKHACMCAHISHARTHAQMLECWNVCVYMCVCISPLSHMALHHVIVTLENDLPYIKTPRRASS